jgi:hypothetical protein
MLRLLASAFVAVLLTAPIASAQTPRQRGSYPVEFGIDGDVFFGLESPRTTLITLPAPIFRVGFIITDKLEMEPRFSLTSAHVSGFGSFTDYSFELGVLYQPAGDRVGNGFYARPFVGVSGGDDSQSTSSSDGYAGLGLGLKLPLSGRRLAFRPEAAYMHNFGTGGGNAIALILGLSFFTR